ncbi:MAG: hypothetical protein GY749_30665 [Desulfobacteraceae bacterium]|nr:hypothetical protein [Desulfobacteraceae bacterium]
MRTVTLLVVTLLLILPLSAKGESSGQKPALILYTDYKREINLNDLSTVIFKANRIIYHMLKNVLPQKYGIPIKLKPVQWSRGLDLIKMGFADGILNASYSEARTEYAVYPMKDGKHNPAKRLKGIEYAFYKNKNSSIEWDGQKITKIDGDIGAVKSFSIVKDLQKMGIAVKESQFPFKILKDLAIGKLKAVGIQSHMVDPYIEKNSFLAKNIIKFQTPLKKKDYYLIFSKKFYSERQDTAEHIWDKIEEYSRSDDYKRAKQDFEK